MNRQDGFIIKEQLKERIGGRKVLSALFYTFNFDPRFFENYIMPLLVPDQQFINNAIANHIIWRKLYKDHRVPPITVYFDQDAMNRESGPMLDYDFVAVRMPMTGRNKGNFHPKVSFILVEGKQGENELIILTGSNNITQNGWCENMECIFEQVLINGKYFPKELKIDYRNFIYSTLEKFGRKETEAETKITAYLGKIGNTNHSDVLFYNSFQGSFEEFMDTYVLKESDVHTVEIISPYFSDDAVLIDYFTSRKMKVKIEAPIRNKSLMIRQEVFESMSEKGVHWFHPTDESRNNHSKVYRLHSQKYTYTILGSVNFTKPAWHGWSNKDNTVSNIEGAILIVEKAENGNQLLHKPLKNNSFSFIEPDGTEESYFERVEVPDITFTINWISNTISWKSKTIHPCFLDIPGSNMIKVEGTGKLNLNEIKHTQQIIEAIARKPLFRVEEHVGNKIVEHYYYTAQEGFEQRPAEFRISANDIIEAWELLGEGHGVLNDWLLNRLELITDKFQDASGRLIADQNEEKSLLNEMARHFYGLVKLEDFLFDERMLKSKQEVRIQHFNNLSYYLTYDNVDTLISYLRDLEKSYAEQKLLPAYYWILLQVIRSHFFAHVVLNTFLKICHLGAPSELRNVKLVVEQQLQKLDATISHLENQWKFDKKKLKWAQSILAGEHELSE